MPSTVERIRAIGQSARPTPKGHVITLDLYMYPDGTGAIRSKGVTGVGRSLQTKNDEDLLSLVEDVVAEIRDEAGY